MYRRFASVRSRRRNGVDTGDSVNMLRTMTQLPFRLTRRCLMALFALIPAIASCAIRQRPVSCVGPATSAAQDCAQAEVPVTPEAPFWIASVAKTFLGLLLLQLEAERKVSLDDRIAAVPDWKVFCDSPLRLSVLGAVMGGAHDRKPHWCGSGFRV